MRLDRLIAAQLAISRRGASTLIRAGRVTLDGAIVRRPADHVDPDAVDLGVDGEPVAVRREVTLLLHKPAGVLSATHDDHDVTVLGLVPRALRRRGLAPVGRLDRDTTGLLVLTTDGALNHRLTHPGRHVPRVYRAEIVGEALLDAPESTLAARFAGGIELRDGTRCQPAGFVWRSHGVARVTLREGKYHQVKRMVAACGGRVVTLHREAIGDLWLPADLAPGEIREASAADLAALQAPPPLV